MHLPIDRRLLPATATLFSLPDRSIEEMCGNEIRSSRVCNQGSQIHPKFALHLSTSATPVEHILMRAFYFPPVPSPHHRWAMAVSHRPAGCSNYRPLLNTLRAAVQKIPCVQQFIWSRWHWHSCASSSVHHSSVVQFHLEEPKTGAR